MFEPSCSSSHRIQNRGVFFFNAQYGKTIWFSARDGKKRYVVIQNE